MEAQNKHKIKEQRFFLGEIFSSVKNFFLSAQCIVGLDIGTSYIKIAQLQRSGANYVISNYRVRGLPSIAKDNPQEKKKLVNGFIKEFIYEARIKTKLCKIALWGEGCYVFAITIPSASEKELKAIVGVELKKKLPFQVDLTNILYNFFVTNKFKEEKGTTFQVTCIAMDQYVLGEHIKAVKELDMRPIAVNVIPDALSGLVNSVAKDYDCVAVLDIGTKESVLNFYKKGLLQFNRQIPIGGEQLTQAIMKAMMTLGMSNVTDENAEKVKRQCGIPLEEDVFVEYFTDFGIIKGNQIAVALRPMLERFSTEITRTVTYYYRTFRVNKIDCLYFTGGSSRLKNIDKFLSSNTQTLHIAKVEKLDPLKAVKGWTDSGVFRHDLVMEEAAPHLSAAFGLCVNKGGKINLLPAKEKLEQRINFIAVLTRILFFLFLAGILGVYSFSYSKCLLYNKLINTTKAEIGEFSIKIKEIKSYMAMKGILTERKSLLEDAIGRQPLWWGMLKELSNITPDSMALRRLNIKREKEQRKIYIIGEVFAEYITIDLSISQYLVALDESPYFTNVRPVSTKRDVYSPVPKANFEIVADLVY